MTDEEYMAYLYDRGARRLGYESYEALRADLDASLARRRAREDGDLDAWGKAQLSSD